MGWQSIVDSALDKVTTADFWRGVIYLAAAVGVHVSPENAGNIVSTALLISGALHTIWHKTYAPQ